MVRSESPQVRPYAWREGLPDVQSDQQQVPGLGSDSPRDQLQLITHRCCAVISRDMLWSRLLVNHWGRCHQLPEVTKSCMSRFAILFAAVSMYSSTERCRKTLLVDVGCYGWLDRLYTWLHLAIPHKSIQELVVVQSHPNFALPSRQWSMHSHHCWGPRSLFILQLIPASFGKPWLSHSRVSSPLEPCQSLSLVQ